MSYYVVKVYGVVEPHYRHGEAPVWVWQAVSQAVAEAADRAGYDLPLHVAQDLADAALQAAAAVADPERYLDHIHIGPLVYSPGNSGE